MKRDDDKNVTRRSAIAYAAGLSVVFSVLTFLGLGLLLDRWLGTSPWMVAIGIVVGSAIGLYEFIRVTTKL
ncbi:AtpZ/AtpI family protein [Pyrinomonas methylaliphatogenes]|jgi:ATP synthase protein I|uniref:Putative F0F1-ATPase subunit (ATPase_gene1) n=1 Tax=Pyrinomonas methylaliphatogenes TaxID=454194 RepID=A0A0B6X3V8_9BACT|nr:AtpZ/AtpI family protein [Pyrinomonas methylaliphatogenes]MBX5478435.1 AtpZ/AtpI family protein [Pyrinomonas methylaliphatogenes]CDM66970.1 Putative F0F1-ATPase subunit (ATPase_gene1) [Pyrinomonas methylaliphatogenes]